MRKFLSIFAAALVALTVNATAVVLPAVLDVSNVAFRSEGMPDFTIEEGQDYAGTYFDMGAHDSSNDTLLYAEWDVTIEPITYNVAVDVYNTNSWRVQLYVLNQAGDTLKSLRYKGSSGQKGQYAIGALDLSDLTAGDYKVRVHAATAWSAMKLKDVIFTADYHGANVALPGTLTPAYAELSSGASVTNNAIAFAPSTANSEYATWNVTFAEAGTYDVSIDITASNGHNYGVALMNGTTEVDAVNEGGQHGDTGVKALGTITVPAAGTYVVKLTNATQWSEAVLNSITFAAPAEPLMKTIYCKVDKDWWKADNAAVAVYTWNDGGTPKAAWPGERMTPVEGETDLWSFELDVNTYHMCIFTRVNGEGEIADWGAKTQDLTIPTDDNDMFTVANTLGCWNNDNCACDGAWAKFEPTPVGPVIDFTQPFTLKFNGNGASDNSNSFNVESGVAAIFDEASAPYVGALTTVSNVYAARTIADDPSSLKFGTSSKKGTLAFTLGQAIEVDSIIVNATQYGNDAAEVTVNGVVFALTAGNKIPTDCKITPEGTVSEITIAQTGSQRIYVRYVKVYPKTGGETPVEPTLPQVGLGASFNAWDWTTNLLTPAQDELTASITVALEAGNHEFKIVSDGSWLSLNGEGETLYGIHREWTRVEHINLINNGRNFSLNADVAGDYTFTWTYADSTLVVTFPEAPVVSTCDWANIEFLGGPAEYANQFKVCKADGEHPGVVNIQQPGFAEEMGIYMTFPSAAFGEISLPSTAYAVQGAGIIFYLSAFTALETEVSVVVDNNPIVFTVYNAAYEPQPAVPAYYLVGNMTEWAVVADDAHKFAANAEAEGEFMLTYTLAEGDQFKVVKVEEGQENVWYPGGENNNYVVDAAHAGEKTIYFRPAGGQEGWHEGVIYVAGEDTPQPQGPISETWFADANWQQETQSTATWDAEAQKITVNIAVDKNAQWQGQVKINTIQEEAGKFYHFGIKMKANNNVADVTIKWEDNTGTVMEVVALEANTEFVLDRPQIAAAGAGNGILVLDFGKAKAGDVIEIYDIVAEEVAAPTVDLEDGYYVIGLNGWTIYDLTAADKFAANAEAEGEYMITKNLAANNEFKVVAVAENALGAWYPAEAGNYVVDLAHAGEAKTIYFRPNYDGGEGWHAGCIYVAATEGPVNPIDHTFFATGAGWAGDDQSSAVWDPETGKITVTLAMEKVAAWQGQVFVNAVKAEPGKCYNFSVKMKANKNMNGVTLKWQENNNDPIMVSEINTINLVANEEFVYTKTQIAGVDGNGMIVYDFGFAEAGTVVEIYDLVIEETDCPEPVEVNYYLVGSMTNWAVVAEDAYKFAANEAAEGEYMLSYTLAEGDQFKVVKVEGETQTWYPGGMDNNYVVDAQHAGAATIYFRPAGGVEGWHEGYIYVDTTNGINNTTIDAKAQKFIMNGQLYIIKNGVMYNAQGAVVR